MRFVAVQRRQRQTMSDHQGPYLFDVGAIALAHAGTPVSDRALPYVRQAIAGEIDAIVPYPALVGSHVVLSKYYKFSNAEAARLMQNFMDAGQIHWYEEMSKDLVREGFQQASELNVNGWDGYYAEVAKKEGVETILTVDTDFEQLAGVTAEVILTPDEFETLTEYLNT